jgi:hypothetical protein
MFQRNINTVYMTFLPTADPILPTGDKCL